jgi:hypothetical protein
LDSDNDGVSDAADLCLGTPAGEAVNANGCSASQLDSDNDDVSDAADQCPGTPAGEAANANGCSPSQLDSDNDGVSDAADQCPGTLAGEAVDDNGCSIVNTCPVGTTWDGESCVPIICPFGLTLVGNVCVDLTLGGGGSGISKEPNAPIVPVTGVQPTELSCTAPSTVLEMAGFEVTFTNLCGYSALLDETPEGGLPAAFPGGDAYVGGINITLLQNGVPVSILPAGASITLSFDLPVGITGETLAILYWDPTANGGTGGWVEQSVSVENGQVLVAVDMPGTFVLVDKSTATAQENNLPSLLVNFFKDVLQAFSTAFN